jgi:Rhodanese-like domain
MNTIGTVIKDVLSDRKKRWLRIAIGVFVVIIAALLAVRLVAQAKQNRLLALNDQAIMENPGADPEIDRVPLAQARAAFDSHQAVFVDVRSAESYAAGHIPGAINIPLAQILNSYHRLDSSRWIILYCT